MVGSGGEDQMSDDLIQDDSSHYEISLTAGQAFIAFVLLLFSLAAAFAFGLIIGRGQGGEDRLVVRREPAVITDGAAPGEESQIVELDGRSSGQPPETPAFVVDEVPADPPDATSTESPAPTETVAPPAATPPAQQPAPSGPVFAQVLSSTEASAAENLAARLIESGFNTAYVERVPGPSGMIYRVRVRFPSEAEARAASDRLRSITNADPWITRQ